ncbi:alpha/beta hydrolase [Paenibacillus sp. UKAQ_18]|uniref:alpha/beta fold hydrolase n=1 Tax=Paenibacillus sp. MZ03-122A TaxID=2962033 RepID=UPI001F426E4C|nr:alpha/beta hydrolase [Paenibacillus sp. MZ03-122A]MCF2716751.1 alpha/beta hydrolase [Paenibacillus sp. UKAQ_18]MCP3781228.1 alpha/beta hydrolase [Paenibacillus sp. MZ03-122A]
MKQRRQTWTRIVFLIISCLLLFVISGFVYEWIASKKDKSQYPPPGELVDAGGYRLHIRKLGNGSPTILLESGSGESSLSWRDIPEKLSSFATVVSYDRAGYAWSEEANTPRTGENIVRELHTALKNADIRPPYILVGHSLGGMYSRLYAQTYRDEVAGLVLVDARPENDARRTNKIYAKERPKANPSPLISILLEKSGAFRLFPNFMLTGRVEYQDRKSFVNIVASSKYFRSVAEEGDLASTTEDAIRGQHLGNLPVRVIARGIQQDLTQFGISKRGNNQIEQSWQIGQREMLNISTNSKLIVAKKSEHMIIHDQPDLVIQVIRELITNTSHFQSTTSKAYTDD